MRVSMSIMLLACTVLLTPLLSAADLTKIGRSIRKEPAYQSKPRYCLLVFGSDAATRVWLVLDGNRLYVDRNGNGDLTEPGEVITAKDGGYEGDAHLFSAGEIPEGKLRHKNLTVRIVKLDRLAGYDEQAKEILAKNPHGSGYAAVEIEIEMPGHKDASFMAGQDVTGVLQFADRASDAPIIHFGGPWQLSLFGRQRLTAGREADLILGLGTPGVGAGTTSYVAYEGVVPENVRPTAEITYPPRREGETPLRELYELKQRC